ncbi:MAG: hypothetical protein AAF745_14875 [Planctomycetota bacterium]
MNGQPAADSDEPASEPASNSVTVSVAEPVSAGDGKPVYPRAVAVQGDQLWVVDLDLPGIWSQKNGSNTLFTPGTKLLRKPMNRPWCVTAHPGGGILIGDSATREIYHAADQGTNLTALGSGYIGIPMAITVSPDSKQIYVGDAERRAIFRLPIGGGNPELVVRVNARGLSFDGQGLLWAVTPDAEAVCRIDTSKKTAEPIVTGRPYQFPNGIVWVGDHGYVTDGYGKSIWKFTADGKTEKWFTGQPLTGPVGITADDEHLYVCDPRTQQVYQFDRATKVIEKRF